MRIAVAQMNTHAGDFAGIASRMEAFVSAAVGQGAEFVVFPMAALCGPLPLPYSHRAGYQVDLLQTLDRMAEAFECPCLVPVVAQMDGEPYHEVMLLQNGKVTALRARSYYAASDARTQGASTQGASQPVTTFELDGLRFALAMTYEDLDDLLDASVGIDVVVYVSDYAFALDDAASALGAALTESRFRTDAVSLDAWFVAAGSVGGYGLQVYTGSSFVLSPAGDLVASAPAFEDAMLMAQVGARGTASEGVELLEPELYNRSLHLWETLVLGLRDYLEKQGHTDVALVVEGDLCSCVLAALASDALGPTHVHAVIGAPSGEATCQVAKGVLESLRIVEEECDLDWQVSDDALAADLLQACLASVSRRYGAVALAACDKTYLALEAHAQNCRTSELLPLGDVYRSDVVELAHLRNTISPVIPLEAISRFGVPSVEGLDDAEPSKETRLRRVDVTLATHIEWERCMSDVVARQGEPEVTKRIIDALWEHEEPRLAFPHAITASSHPLLFTHVPLGYAWSDHVRSEEERLKESHVEQQLLSSAEASGTSGEKPRQEGVPGFDELLGGLGLELQSGSIPEGVSRESLEGTMSELMGLIQDLLQNGEQPPSIGGPFGPLTWGGPFSEN